MSYIKFVDNTQVNYILRRPNLVLQPKAQIVNIIKKMYQIVNIIK